MQNHYKCPEKYLFIMSEDLSDSFSQEPPLPFGQRVYSEAYEFQASVKVSQNSIDLTHMFSVLKEAIQNAKNVLSNPSLSETERVKRSLKILEQEGADNAQVDVKTQQKQQQPTNNFQMKVEQQLEETIQIVLDQMSEFQSSQSRQKTSSDNSFNREYELRKANGGKMSMEEEIHELKRRLHSKETELMILMKEKNENQARLENEIDELLAKMEKGNSDQKKIGRFQDKSQDMGKMNKWVENLKQMLQSAQRQTVAVKEQLKRSDETIKAKDEEIRQLRRKLVEQQVEQQYITLTTEQLCNHIKSSFSKLQPQHRLPFKEELTQFIHHLG